MQNSTSTYFQMHIAWTMAINVPFWRKIWNWIHFKRFSNFFLVLARQHPLHISLLFYITTTAIAFAEILTLRGLSLKWWSTILNWIVLLCKNSNAPHQQRQWRRWTEFQTDGTRELRASKNIRRNHLLLLADVQLEILLQTNFY